MMNRTDRVTRLSARLNQAIINHEDNIMLCDTLKEAHVYCVINDVSTQQYGPLLERFIRVKFNYAKNKAEDCTGDCSKNGKNTEIKVSLGGKTHTKFNFVQLRPSHNCDSYILTAYHLSFENVNNEGDLYIFKIPTVNLKNIIATYGGYAHGTTKEHGNITTDSLNAESIKEYAIRPTINSDCWKTLMMFRVYESDL